MDDRAISYLGLTKFRGTHTPFGIRQSDRRSHLYVIGATGTGKSTLLEHLARQDLANGRGFVLIDPHGDLAERLWADSRKREGVTYLDAADPAQPFGYNPLRRVRDDKVPLAVSGLIDAFKKLWSDAWGVRMEHILRNCLYALMEQGSATLPDILRLLWDDLYLRAVVARTRNPMVRQFFVKEFANYAPRQKSEAIAPIENKLGALLTDPRLYRILVAPEQPISFRRIMDRGEVLLVNLAKGRLGENSANVLGGLIASTIGLAALSRADEPVTLRRPFHVYIDEFQSFTTLAFASMLPELRKYGVGFTLAHQYLAQLAPEVRHAVLGNAGTILSFRVGAEDAAALTSEFSPAFSTLDLMNLANFDFYLRLMIDGAPSKPFSGQAERTVAA
jgi:type IV secretory pathway TraG/TraD family ATPase VirD4